MRNPSELRAIWAAYVRKLRDATGMSRPELARRLGVDPATVWRWETQKQKPESPDIPEAIARLFGIEVDEVLAAAGLKSEAAVPAEPSAPLSVDEEIELVRTDERLDEETKARIIAIILDRRARERELALDDTRKLIDLMRERRARREAS